MSQTAKVIWWIAAGTFAIGLIFAVNPALLPFSCPLQRMTGLFCPGCGSTRALHQLAHGNLLAAFRFNPLAICALPALAVLAIRGRSETLPARWIWTALFVVIGFGVARNLPWYPFTLLTPGLN